MMNIINFDEKYDLFQSKEFEDVKRLWFEDVERPWLHRYMPEGILFHVDLSYKKFMKLYSQRKNDKPKTKNTDWHNKYRNDIDPVTGLNEITTTYFNTNGYHLKPIAYKHKVKDFLNLVFKWHDLITKLDPCIYFKIIWRSSNTNRSSFLSTCRDGSYELIKLTGSEVYKNIRGMLRSMKFLPNFSTFKEYFELLIDGPDNIFSSRSHELQIAQNDEPGNTVEMRKILWYYKENCDQLPNAIVTIFDYRGKQIVGNLWNLVTWGLGEVYFNSEPNRPESHWATFLTKGFYDPRLLFWIFAFAEK